MGEVLPLDSARRRPPRGALWREAVGEILRNERRARRERLVDVARRANVSPQYLSELERGVKDASSEVLRAVSAALELSVAEVARRSADRVECVRLASPALLAA